MDESKAPPRTIKVVDRRKFTSEGEVRDDVSPAESVPPRPLEDETPSPAGPSPTVEASTPGRRPPPAAPAPEPPEASRSASAQTSREFLELVGMLAQNAELLLAGADDLPAQPAEARRVIDWLAMLERKTAGNLSAEELKILTDIVFQLRAAYLQRTR